MADAAIRADVEHVLRMQAALDQIYGVVMSLEDLQSELDRMAATSRAPGQLRK